MSEKFSLNMVLLIGAGVAVLVVAVIAVVLYVLPALGVGEGGYTRLEAATPNISHPDGILVTFQGGDPVSVSLASQSREQFLAGQASATWASAYAQLPADLTMLSPIFTVDTREDPMGRLYAEMNIPNGAEPLETLSLYAWDEQTGTWVFMPSQQDIVRDVIGFTPTGNITHVAAFQKVPAYPSVNLVIRESTTLDAAVAQSLVTALPTGVTLLADGTLGGQPVSSVQTGGALVLPLVSNTDGDSGAGLHTFGDAALNETAISSLSGLAAGYSGLTLDFEVSAEERDAFSAFVEALANRLHGEGKTLSVVMRSTTLTAYDLEVLNRTLDQIWWAPGDDPTAYLEGGSVQNVLYALVGEMDRRKLGLLVSSNSIDVSPSTVTPLTSEAALEVFGEVAAIEGYLSEEGSTVAGEQIPFRLTGALQAMAYDPSLGANYVAYTSEDGATHYIYFGSAEGLTRKLNWAARYGLNAVAVESGDDALAVNAATSGLSAFIAQTPAAPPPALSIVWQVVGGENGTALSESSGDLNDIQYLWIASDDPGDYLISAAVSGQAESSRGEVLVKVAEGAAPEPEPVVQQTTTQDTSTAEADTGATAVAPVDAPPPVASAGSAAGGSFELGGMVRGGEYYGYMHQAGMTWVKFQLRGLGNTGEAVGYIEQAHANGFKVLLSVLGGHDIDFNAWAQYFGQLGALGPDAIEVWNEPNFSREWPEQHMGGDRYVELMLAPSYNAIKAANPNVMVISGAPTPTGAFQGCSFQEWIPMTGCDDNVWLNQVAAAGGSSYMDCVGTHFNAGATAPSATSGHPAGGHYSWYYPTMVSTYSVIGRPLCFTELGYVIGPGLPEYFAWANDNTVEEQAAWLAEAAAMSSQRNVRLMIVWNVGGFTSGGGDPQTGYAIVRGDGSCPACSTLGSVMGVQ
jgi:hypothetical protein